MTGGVTDLAEVIIVVIVLVVGVVGMIDSVVLTETEGEELTSADFDGNISSVAAILVVVGSEIFSSGKSLKFKIFHGWVI